MAAPLTLAATTAEQQAFELCTKLAQAIAAYTAANPAANLKSMRVTQAIDLNNSRATFSITLPLVQSQSTDGGIEFDADPVLA
jgi:hypothetical protein